MKHVCAFLVTMIFGLILMCSNATGDGWIDRTSIGGFASSNFEVTDSTVPFNGGKNVGLDNQGSLSGTRMGIMINSEINRYVRLVAQMFSTKEENFNLNIDWAFADLRLTDQINLRTGKVKFPAGLLRLQLFIQNFGRQNGPQMTRESYTSGSLLVTTSNDNWSLDADFFGGEINLKGSKVRTLGGAKVAANFDDMLLLQSSIYEGTMRGTANPAMEEVNYTGTMVGAKADWDDVVVYAEYSSITMGNLAAMKAVSWYTSEGYQ